MRLRLTTLTPLHIGGREGALNPLEFIVFEGHCYVIAEAKFSAALQQHGRLDAFYTWFVGQERPVLRDFLRDHRLLNTDFLQRVAAYASVAPMPIQATLRPYIRDAFNRPFLPGTAIKGALRTAFLYK